MKKLLILILGICTICFSCSTSGDSVTIKDFAQIAETYHEKISQLEAKRNPTDITSFLQINDSIRVYRTEANKELDSLFLLLKDTIYIPFTQTENINRLEIIKVWITSVQYNEIYIEALVKALDNSGIHGPYTSVSSFDTENNRLATGGGIGGNPEERVRAGETYIFSGKVDNLHLLTNFRRLQFDEDIKKW